MIGFPKTPGVPLVNNQSDEESEAESKKDSESNDSDSEQSDDENERAKSGSDDNQSDSDNQPKQRKESNTRAHKSSDSDSDSDSDNELKQSKAQSDKSDDENSKDSDSSSVKNTHRQNDSSSENETRQVSRKRKKMVSSDESEQENSGDDENKNPDAKDLFGDLSDEDDDKEDGKKSDNSDDDGSVKRMRVDDEEEENFTSRIVDDEERQDQGMDEEFEEQVPETRIEVEIPRIVANLGEKLHFVKLPNFLSIDTHPYDPQWYEDEIDEDEVHDDEGRARLKLKVENTLRWRNVTDEDGNVTKESNARVVKWSDGSMSLLLGDEIFDIQTLNLLPGENNHLFIRQGTGLQVCFAIINIVYNCCLLQGQSVFRTKLIFRPFSTESFTHRKLTLSLADRSQKTQKICVLPSVGKDPEAHRSEMIKKEEDRLRAQIRKENKARKIKERAYSRVSTPFLENDDDDESISISKIKNQYKRGGPSYGTSQYSESDNEEENEDDDDDSDLVCFLCVFFFVLRFGEL